MFSHSYCNLGSGQIGDPVEEHPGTKTNTMYLGHITRYESLEKTILEANIKGRRRPGRPRRRLANDITEWLGIGMHQAPPSPGQHKVVLPLKLQRTCRDKRR